MFPLLALLLFGIIEYGLVFKNATAYSASTRSGARSAVASSRTLGFQDTARRAVESTMDNVSNGAPERLVVYRADPDTGDPLSGDLTACNDCYIFDWDATRPTGEKWVPRWGRTDPRAWRHDEQYACGDADTDVLGIYVEGTHYFVTKFFSEELALDERTVMRLEPQPSSLGSTGCEPTP